MLQKKFSTIRWVNQKTLQSPKRRLKHFWTTNHIAEFTIVPELGGPPICPPALRKSKKQKNVDGLFVRCIFSHCGSVLVFVESDPDVWVRVEDPQGFPQQHRLCSVLKRYRDLLHLHVRIWWRCVFCGHCSRLRGHTQYHCHTNTDEETLQQKRSKRSKQLWHLLFVQLHRTRLDLSSGNSVTF